MYKFKTYCSVCSAQPGFPDAFGRVSRNVQISVGIQCYHVHRFIACFILLHTLLDTATLITDAKSF